MLNAGATKSTSVTLEEIDTLIRARYPILYLLTHEESRLEALLFGVANNQNKQLYVWTGTSGLMDYQNAQMGKKDKGQFTDPTEVLEHIRTKQVSAIFILKDFHPFLDDPHIIRRLRDVAHELKGTYKTILIVSPRLNLPVELEKEITLIDIPLPDISELAQLLKSVCQTVGKNDKSAVNLNKEDAMAIVRAAQGLTLTEAENAFAKAIVNDSVIDKNDIALILKEKQQLIRKSGILEFYPAETTMGEVGGLKNLKEWLKIRGQAFGSSAAQFGLPIPKGVLLLGAPGCGKSLMAKVVANTWQMPLLRLDFGKIFSGLVGSSEENMRRALKVAEGVAPAVLWIDELEKGLSGGTQGTSDGGTAARVFGTFLTWMQEKTSRVFVVATANRIDALPPELMRRGRFDEIFFLDLPSRESREEILKIHIRKKNRKEADFDFKSITSITENFSGSEVEHCILEGLFRAFSQKRELTTDDIIEAAKTTVPLAVTFAEELKRSREWAKNRARSAEETEEIQTHSRAARLEVRSDK